MYELHDEMIMYNYPVPREWRGGSMVRYDTITKTTNACSPKDERSILASKHKAVHHSAVRSLIPYHVGFSCLLACAQ